MTLARDMRQSHIILYLAPVSGALPARERDMESTAGATIVVAAFSSLFMNIH